MSKFSKPHAHNIRPEPTNIKPAPSGAGNAPDTGQPEQAVPGVNIDSLLLYLHSDLKDLRKVTQGMAMYQHGIFRRTSAIIDKMQTRIMITKTVSDFVEDEQANNARIAAMPTVVCGNCDLTVYYEMGLDQYPDLCPRCGISGQGTGEYLMDPERVEAIRLALEENAELPERFANDIDPATLVDGGLPE